MEATCREARRAERSNKARPRPGERLLEHFNRATDRSSDRIVSRTAERKSTRVKDRSRDRLEDAEKTAQCDERLAPRGSHHRSSGKEIKEERTQNEPRHSEHRLAKKERVEDLYSEVIKDRSRTKCKPLPKAQLNDRVPDLYCEVDQELQGNSNRDVKDLEDRSQHVYDDVSDADDDNQAGEEVCVWVDDRQLWVSGVLPSTTCGELVRALLPHQPEHARTSEADWVITERWRSMEQPLDRDATILDIWNAWGDAQNEIRFTLRYVDSSGDSGRGSPPSPHGPSRRRHPNRRRSRQLFPQLLRAQGDTLVMQADRLREQDRQISHLEEQTHKSRMAKHGPNYLLESYLRDIARNNELANTEHRQDELAGISELNNLAEYNHKPRETIESQETSPNQSGETIDNHARSSEATDSPAANSDSGVGVSGSPPRATKRRSRGRLLLREHYLTKELTDICQINANRIVQTKSDDNSETSTDELSRIQQQIEILEKLTIVNKRLQREEELIVRLGVKLRRYLCEDEISYIESEDQIVTMLNTLRSQMDNSSKEIEMAAIEMERADYQLEKRKNILDLLYKEMADVDLEGQTLEVQNTSGECEQQMFADIGAQPPYNENVFCNLTLDTSTTQFVSVNYNNSNGPNYPLDTLV